MHANRQTDGQRRTYVRTDGLTHTPSLTHERLHVYTRCTQVHTHGQIDIRTHVRTETNTQVQTWKLEVKSKKLEVRSKKLEVKK